MNRCVRRTLLLVGIFLISAGHRAGAEQAGAPAEVDRYDVVIYGGTSGGVAAAVQVRRMGKTVVLVEPGKHLGGLTSGGLGATDIGNKGAIGGISREFYRRVRKHYEDPAAWTQQRPEDYKSNRQGGGEDAMWTFEPHVAEQIFDAMVKEEQIVVLRGERLDLKEGVIMKNGRIEAIRLEGGRTIEGEMFIDATYEGDLLALAGVSFTVGREANSQYGETLNGVQVTNAVHHQLQPGVDPYVTPGDPDGGLLPGVHGGGPGEEGSADERVQAYNFRMCLTDAAENRIPFEKPPGYDPRRFELLLRNFEAGEKRIPWSPTMMPNRKTDTNNNFGFSTDNIGMNYGWPEGDYAEREKILADHLLYQQGLMWTLANHPRVPETIRKEVSRWGLSKDEFTESGGWPHQLYVREARRMIADYVMTQHNCQGREVADDPVGLAAYTMDSHNVQRYVDEGGHARNEGDVQVGGFAPYPISYRSLVPRDEECKNLLVPVCLAASHIAYGSIRMEPVFMVLGQSAATAACQAMDDERPVQRIDFAKLKERLLADGQVLAWTGPAPKAVTSIDPGKLAGIVVDDAAAELTGEWLPSRSVSNFVGPHYLHDNNVDQGNKSARFPIAVKESGRYEIRLAYTPNGNRATNVAVEVQHAAGKETVVINQRKEPPIDNAFISLGTFDLIAGKPAAVVISNDSANGHVIADAVWIVPAKK